MDGADGGILENKNGLIYGAGGSPPAWRAALGESAGRFEGEPHGSDVSFLVINAAPGQGPALHRHPYSETCVVQAGRARFVAGERSIDAVAGDVLVVAPGEAHGFRALGPERLQLVAIHAAPRMETTSVEGQANHIDGDPEWSR